MSNTTLPKIAYKKRLVHFFDKPHFNLYFIQKTLPVIPHYFKGFFDKIHLMRRITINYKTDGVLRSASVFVEDVSTVKATIYSLSNV